MAEVQWYLRSYDWLVYSAFVGSVILATSLLVLAFCRQPVRCIRLIELAAIACLAAPWMPMVPGYPELHFDWLPLPPAGQATPAADPRPDTPLTDTTSPSATADATSSAAAKMPEVSVPAGTGSVWWSDYRFWMVTGYFAGVTALASWWLMGVSGIWAVMRSARTAPAHCHKMIRSIAGKQARPRVLMSERVGQPCTVLWLRPVIILPTRLCLQGNEQALRWSLGHEWSHVVRGDTWRWSLVNLVRLIFFYNPLAWCFRNSLQLYQDYLADVAAVGHTSSPEDYADFLTSEARQCEARPTVVGLGIGGNKSDLYRRIVMLLKPARLLERRSPRFWNVLVIVTAVLLFVGLTSSRPVSNSAADAPSGSSGSFTGAVYATEQQADPETTGPADDTKPLRILSGIEKDRLRYGQKSFGQWRAVLETDLEPSTRLQAIRALEAFGVNGYAKESVSVISEVLKDDHERVVSAACQALANIGPAAVEALTQALGSDVAYIRKSAAAGLAALGPPARSAVPALVETTKDKEAGVRQTACDALANIGVASEPVVSALLRLVRDDSSQIRLRASSALGRIAPPTKEVIDALILVSEESALALKLFRELGGFDNVDTSVPVLIGALKSSDVKIRFAAIEALAEIGPAAKPAIPALTALRKDQSSPNEYLSRIVFTDNVVTIGTRAKQLLEKLKKAGGDR